jgi:hypothetical protein
MTKLFAEAGILQFARPNCSGLSNALADRHNPTRTETI